MKARSTACSAVSASTPARAHASWRRAEAFRPDLAMKHREQAVEPLHRADPRVPLPDLSEAANGWAGRSRHSARRSRRGRRKLQKLKSAKGSSRRGAALPARRQARAARLVADRRPHPAPAKEALYRQMRATDNPEDLPDVMKDPVIQPAPQPADGPGGEAVTTAPSSSSTPAPDVVHVRRQIEEIKKRISARPSASSGPRRTTTRRRRRRGLHVLRSRVHQAGDPGPRLPQRALRCRQAGTSRRRGRCSTA